MRTGKHPFALVGCLELVVRIVTGKPSLRTEDALAKPTECGRSSFGHVALRPAPSLVTNQPADGAALQVALVVGSGYPECHAIGKVNGGIAQLVLVCRVQSFDWLTTIE